jgi:hypothetical protein
VLGNLAVLVAERQKYRVRKMLRERKQNKTETTNRHELGAGVANTNFHDSARASREKL